MGTPQIPPLIGFFSNLCVMEHVLRARSIHTDVAWGEQHWLKEHVLRARSYLQMLQKRNSTRVMGHVQRVRSLHTELTHTLTRCTDCEGARTARPFTAYGDGGAADSRDPHRVFGVDGEG